MKHFIQISRVLAAKKLYLFVLVMLMSVGAMAGTKEVYSSYNEAQRHQLTFYYDDLRQLREAEGKITEIYDPVRNPDAERFKNYRTEVWFGMIDVSMKDAPLTSTRKMFYGLEEMLYIDQMYNLVTDEVNDMSCMFSGCKSLRELDLKKFNTANVTDMSRMFDCCYCLQSLILTSFNTTKVTNMSQMFSNCYSLRALNVWPFNIDKVWNMTGMFRECNNLSIIWCGNDWSTSAVLEESQEMFKGCIALVGEKGTSCDGVNSIDKICARPDGQNDLPGYFTITDIPKELNTKEVYTSFKNNTLTFYCDNKRLTRTLDGEITEIYDPVNNPDAVRFYRYYDKVKKAKIDVSMKDTLLTSTQSMFYSRYDDQEIRLMYLTEIQDLKNLITDKVTNMNSMFRGCSSFRSLDLRSLNTANVTDMSKMLYYCFNMRSVNLSSFNTANVTDMSEMFGYCQSLTSLDLHSFNTANVKNMGKMFFNCFALTSLDLSSFNTAKVTNMSAMFKSCGLKSIDLSLFNTANVTEMSEMFNDCSFLTSLDLHSFNTANVPDMSYMFSNCTRMKSIDLSSFNTANVTNMKNMFYNCSSLTTIYCNDDWSKIPTLKNSKDMFSGCTKIKGIQGTTYLEDKYDVTYARPDGGSGRPGYFTNTAEIYTSFEVPTGVMTYYYDDLRTRRKDICELYTPEKGNDMPTK